MAAPYNAAANERQLYARLHVALHDLYQARSFASHIEKKGWHFEPWERRWTTYMQQSAFTTALAIAYSRPFTESRGWPKFPSRFLSVYDEKQRNLHKRILKLRNLVYAHSDIGTRFIRPVDFGGFATAIEALPTMRFTKEEIECILAMIALLETAIRERLQQLIGAVSDEA